MSDTKKPRIKNVPVTGDHTMFTDRDVITFETVMTYGAEIHAAVEAHSPVDLRGDRLTKFDYLLSLKTCAEKNLNKGLLKNFRKLLNGVEIGAGSRRMLIAKLGRLFASKEYALSPVGRFFCPADAWATKIKKQRETLALAMTPRQIEKAVVKFNALPAQDAGIGVRHYDTTTMIVAEPLVAEIHTAPDRADADAARRQLQREIWQQGD